MSVAQANRAVTHPNPKCIIVMTGATSGFGVYTLQRFAALPDTRVIIGARGSGRSAPAGPVISG